MKSVKRMLYFISFGFKYSLASLVSPRGRKYIFPGAISVSLMFGSNGFSADFDPFCFLQWQL